MKTKIDAVIVVEGQSDVAFLESFIEADFVITNGSEISQDTLLYLKQIHQKRNIIILTDPDYPGLLIRSRLAEQLPNAKHAYIRKEFAQKHHKIGVAESTKAEVLQALTTCLITHQPQALASDLTMMDLYHLHLMGHQDSEAKRKAVSDYFKLGYYGNAKRFLKRLHSLGITRQDLERMEETKHDCE